MVRNFLERFGYYDIFLVDLQSGKIVYSVFKELDDGTSLRDGPYADTNFGVCFREAAAAEARDAVVLVNYECYTPSYEAPASFIGSPIFDGDRKVGVAVDHALAGETGCRVITNGDGNAVLSAFAPVPNTSFRSGAGSAAIRARRAAPRPRWWPPPPARR